MPMDDLVGRMKSILEEAVRTADNGGLCIEITRQSHPPLAQGNWTYQVDAWQNQRFKPTGPMPQRLVRYRHIKTNGLYEILACGKQEADESDVVVYRNVATGEVWVRPRELFFDGRFRME